MRSCWTPVPFPGRPGTAWGPGSLGAQGHGRSCRWPGQDRWSRSQRPTSEWFLALLAEFMPSFLDVSLSFLHSERLLRSDFITKKSYFFPQLGIQKQNVIPRELLGVSVLFQTFSKYSFRALEDQSFQAVIGFYNVWDRHLCPPRVL